MERRKRNRIFTLCATVLLSAAASGIVLLPSEKAETQTAGILSLASEDRGSSIGSSNSRTKEKKSVSAAPAFLGSATSSLPSSGSAVESSLARYYDVPLDDDIQNLIFSECSSRKVPSDLVVALIGVESGFNPSRISKTNDYGLMQINICHRDFLKKKLQITDLLDERQNIRAGVYMLSGIVGRYSDVNQALMVYNCGEAGAKKLWNQGVYSTAYSRKVIETAAELKG